MSINELTKPEKFQSKIITIRNVPVMLDSTLASIYQIETRTLKQAVRRNRARFPQDFMFELTGNEIDLLVSQSVIPSKSYFGGATPFAFTEQGVAMLSSVLKSSTAIEINIKVMRSFVELRKFLITNVSIFHRLDKVEQKQIVSDKKFERIFDALEDKSIKPSQGIFYDGQIFDAYVFVADLIKSATKSIVLIDNYTDESVLQLFSKRNEKVSITIYTKNFTKILKQDLKKYNSQYSPITIKEFSKAHDRFLIIDKKIVYHFEQVLKIWVKNGLLFRKWILEL